MARVSVLYALPDEQVIVDLEYEPGMTALAAVRQSGLMQRFPVILESELLLGVFGRPLAADAPVRPGDRIEISRPLQTDPREMRREFLLDGRVMGGAEGRAMRRQEAVSSVRSSSMPDTRPSWK